VFVTSSGQYTITTLVVIPSGSAEILGSPLIVTILPAELEPSISVFDAPTVYTAGVPSTLVIIARDIYGNSIQAQDCTIFSAQIIPILTVPTKILVVCAISINPAGRCQALCIPPWIGTLNVSVTANSQHIGGSPLTAEVQPGITCASKSFLSGSSLSIATAGQFGMFVVATRDYILNLRSGLDDRFSGSLSGPSSGRIIFGPWKDGKHNGTYLVTCSGQYSMSVKLGGLFNVGSAIPSLTVWPSALCASASIVQGDGLTIATSSIQTGFVVMARDQFGNRLTGTTLQLQVILGSSSLGAYTADKSAAFRVQYTPFQSGLFNLTAFVSNMPVFLNRSVLVNPANVRSECTTAAGAALTLRTAGATAIFTILSSDCFGKQRYISSNQDIAVQSSAGRNIGMLAATYYEDIFEYPVVPGWDIDGLDFSSPQSESISVRNWKSARWSGQIWTPSDDIFTFYSQLVAPTERMRLWIDSNLLVDMVCITAHSFT
jgi:hypothetical protein